MLSFFTSSDWAIIATQLLAGFITTSAVMGFMLWRRSKAHINRAEQLLADQNAIIEASGEMFEQQIRKKRPDVDFDEQTRKQYAERSADVIKAMVAPWLEPQKTDLTPVARTMLKTRQQDVIELLDLLGEPPKPENQIELETFERLKEKAKGLVSQVKQLEQELANANEQHSRTQEHLDGALDTVNTMVREYGRHFELDEKPKVDALLRAIIMNQAMDQGDDCETARAKAEAVTSEEIEAVTQPPAGKTAASAAAAGKTAASEALYGDESEPKDSPEGTEKTGTDSEQTPTDAASTEEPAAEQSDEPDDDDIDALLNDAENDNQPSNESAQLDADANTSQPDDDDIDALLDDTQNDNSEPAPQSEPTEASDDTEKTDNPSSQDTQDDEFDDIDALLDEEQDRSKVDEKTSQATADDNPEDATSPEETTDAESAPAAEEPIATPDEDAKDSTNADPDLDEIDALLAGTDDEQKTDAPATTTADSPETDNEDQAELDDIDALFETADADDDESEPPQADADQAKDREATEPSADASSEEDDIDALLNDTQEANAQPDDLAEQAEAGDEKTQENHREAHKAEDEDDIVDLDEVEIPKNEAPSDEDDLDLDDIDQLLDDEIDKHHAKHTEESRNQNR